MSKFCGEINIGVDIDGTLTNERLGEDVMTLTSKQIEKRYMECTLKKGTDVLFQKGINLFAITGRREMHKEITKEWFNMVGIHYKELVMVPNDFYPNNLFDMNKYIGFKINSHLQRSIRYGLDDSIYVIDALKKNGIIACKVDGDFRNAFENLFIQD